MCKRRYYSIVVVNDRFAEPLVRAWLAAAAHLGNIVLLVAGCGGGFPPLQGVVDAARVPVALPLLATRLVELEAGLSGCGHVLCGQEIISRKRRLW